MYIRLDSLHKLVFNFKNRNWVLYRCKRSGPYTKKKAKELKKSGKTTIVLQNEQGERAFAIWARISAHVSGNIDGALMDWLYSILGAKFKSKELRVENLVEVSNAIRDTISRVVMMSNILNIKMEFVNITPQQLKEAEVERQKLTRVHKSDNPKARRKTVSIVGPETVIVSTVDDKTDDGMFYHYSLKTSEDGSIRVKRTKMKKPVAPVDYIVDTAGNELILTPFVVGTRGRKAIHESEKIMVDGSLAPAKRGKLSKKKKKGVLSLKFKGKKKRS